MLRVALKFCGGCDPSFDRSGYWAAIQEESQGRIEWVSLEEGGYGAVLVINGCDTACLDRELESGELEIAGGARVVSVCDEGLGPALVVKKLTEAEARDEE